MDLIHNGLNLDFQQIQYLMIPLLLRLDLFFGWSFRWWWGSDLEHLKLPLSTIHRLWKIFRRLSHIGDDGRKELLPVALVNVSILTEALIRITYFRGAI